MELKPSFIDTVARKLLSYLPVRWRVKIKRQILSWIQDDQPSVIKDITPDTSPEKATLENEDKLIHSESVKDQIVRSMKTLGFPIYDAVHIYQQTELGLSLESLKKLHWPEVRYTGRSGTILVSICTMNYLHFARTMVNSVRAHHTSEEMAVCLLIVDWDGQEPVDLQDVTVLAGRAIGIDRFDYMALKYNAMELCCACKPHLLRYVMAITNYKKILFIDSDIFVFARLDDLLTSLDTSSLVVTPHTLAPPPTREGSHVRPRLKEIIYAGTYNSGMIGMTVTLENDRFVGQWAELLVTPVAFLNDADVQNVEQEQQIFNWLVSLADGVKILKNTSYNAAYWNLHDRSLRYTGWDQQDQDATWKVDGNALVAFHFSGFSLSEPRRLSRHDFRYEIYFLPSVTKLIEFYLGKLHENGGRAAEKHAYRFDSFPSGLPINAEIRLIFKKHEPFLWRDIDPWSETGEYYYTQCLFLPIVQTASLLPVILYYIYQRRIDLQAAFPQAHLEPDAIISWFSHSGLTEEPTLYEYFNLRRPVVPKLDGIHTIADILHTHPGPFVGLDQPMAQGRSKLIGNLREAGLEAIANKILSLDFELFAISPIYLLWRFVKQHPDLQQTFPDMLFIDAPAFGEWLKQNAPVHFLAPEMADFFLQKAQGHSLARIFSFINESWGLASQWPLALVGQGKESFIRALLSEVQYDRQYDLDDIVMYMWVMEVKPWAGLPLTFELLVNACREPSPLLPEGQDALLGSLLAHPGFREALEAYRAQANKKQQDEISERKIGVMAGWPDLETMHRHKVGVNFFGFFKSPIGLGSLSNGLALALRAADIQVSENVMNNAAMERDLRPEDFIRTYDYSHQTNLFLSYPHLMYRLLATYPHHVVRGKRNIVYLAWEQRDGYPSWEQDYAEFDQIWALSHFAAESFRRYMKRDDVVVVPGVVDLESFPKPATKDDVGLDPDRFIFLYVFDAQSSIERKNPEAAIQAFSKAFSGNEKVQLLLKVSNAHRLDCRQRLRRLVGLAARSDVDIRFLMSYLPRPRLLQTISAVDCYVSLHRAEGFGYTCAEAMAYAKPVIATNYSGTTEFMDGDSAFLVDYKECEVIEADGPFQRGSVWAEPNIEHATAQLRQVYLDQEFAKKIGLAGQAKVRELLSARRVGQIAAAALTKQTR